LANNAFSKRSLDEINAKIVRAKKKCVHWPVDRCC